MQHYFAKDDHGSIGKFCSIADKHDTSDTDATMAEVLLTISNKCLQCHSNSPTAKEVYRICYNVCLDMKFLRFLP